MKSDMPAEDASMIQTFIELECEIDKLKKQIAELEYESELEENDPGVPDCVECGNTIYSGINGQVEVRKQNGGYEWAVDCDLCQFTTFSATFRNYDEQ
jgi:hypothetical protein